MSTLASTIKSLDEEYLDFDKKMEDIEEHRNYLLNKTRAVLENVNIDDISVHQGRSAENFANLVSSYNLAIQGVEKKSTNQVALKLKLKDSQRADNASEAVQLLLEKLNKGEDISDYVPTETLEQQAKIVEDRITIDNLPPIEEWEMKTDPNDLVM